MRVLIIDDEKNARDAIRHVIELYCPEIKIVGEADGVNNAKELIENKKPELVFMDIELSDGSAFDVLKKLSTIDFKIIFVSGHEGYAIKAFKFSALDYILKPVHPEELVTAVEKAKQSLEKENVQLKFDAFLSNMENISKEIKRIVLKTSDSIHVINVKEIVRCEADSNYTSFMLTNGKKILVSNTLKEYDEMFSAYNFFRAHQSHLVNIDFISSYEKKEGGYLIMKDKSTVPVSIRKKDALLKLLEKI
jgi:two-component system, LytTR family, response regulator